MRGAERCCRLCCRGYQFTSLDTKYARVLKKSHPGSRLALLTDLDTQFNFNGVDDIDVRFQSSSVLQPAHQYVHSSATRACSSSCASHDYV